MLFSLSLLSQLKRDQFNRAAWRKRLARLAYIQLSNVKRDQFKRPAIQALTLGG
jgi:hypothetical protein